MLHLVSNLIFKFGSFYVIRKHTKIIKDLKNKLYDTVIVASHLMRPLGGAVPLIPDILTWSKQYLYRGKV